MPTVGQVTARQEVTVLHIDGVDEDTTIVFYPDRISPRIMRQYVQLVVMPTLSMPALTPDEDASPDEVRELVARMGEQIEAQVMSRVDSVAEVLSTLLASWNLTEEDGRMVALTPERLSRLGFAFLSRVFGRIMEAIRLGETKGTTSSGHLNGTSGAKPRPRRRS